MGKIKIINLTIILFMVCSCGPNGDDGTTSNLPKLTTEGKNTFAERFWRVKYK